MNATTRTAPTSSLPQRLSALLLALMLTAGMLGGVNHLATAESQAAQMAAAGASAPRS